MFNNIFGDIFGKKNEKEPLSVMKRMEEIARKYGHMSPDEMNAKIPPEDKEFLDIEHRKVMAAADVVYQQTPIEMLRFLPPFVLLPMIQAFFTKVADYLEGEWSVNVTTITDGHNEHREGIIKEAIIPCFFEKKPVNNAATRVLTYLQENGLYSFEHNGEDE